MKKTKLAPRYLKNQHFEVLEKPLLAWFFWQGGQPLTITVMNTEVRRWQSSTETTSKTFVVQSADLLSINDKAPIRIMRPIQ